LVVSPRAQIDVDVTGAPQWPHVCQFDLEISLNQAVACVIRCCRHTFPGHVPSAIENPRNRVAATAHTMLGEYE